MKGTAEIQSKECAECQRERKERNRVLVNLDDVRVRDAKFVNAPAIFPNNDINYEVTNKRAGIFATSKNEAITWSPAKDCPSSAVLSEKPNIVEEKLGWLQRHDKDCGSLYGMLPLVVGMPVALTDHIDRNPEKNLLRGRIGHIISWALDENKGSVFSRTTDGSPDT